MKMSIQKPSAKVAPSAKPATSMPTSPQTPVKDRDAFTGMLPPGQVITQGMRLTDEERKTLMAAGYKENEPVPANLPSLLEQAKKALQDDEQSRLQQVLNKPPLGKVEEIDITNLPADKQEMIRQSLQAAKEKMSSFGRAATSGPAALLSANAQIKNAVPGAPIEPEFKQEEITLPETPVAPSMGTEDPVKRCVHCGWDPAQHDPTDPSEEDKRAFIPALLGDIRFEKKYVLFNGAVSMVFRSLTTKEAEMCWNAVSDQVNKQALPAAEIYRKLMEYRLACGLKSVTTTHGTIEIPEFHEFEPGPTAQDTLNTIVSRIQEEVTKTEALWRLAGNTFAKFQRIGEKLEVRAHDPNFWKATE